MEIALGLLVLVAVVCAGSALGRKLNISVPLLLVLAGVAGSFLPFVPHIDLNPELVLVGLLPPLLYAAALRTSCSISDQTAAPSGCSPSVTSSSEPSP